MTFFRDWVLRSTEATQFDVHELRSEIANMPSADAVVRLSGELGVAMARLDRLELLCDAILSLAEMKGLFEGPEVEVMMQRLDLLDGVEDVKRGPIRVDSPRCAHCSHFVNPKRRTCVYCDARLPASAEAPRATSPYRDAPPAVREAPHATCARCKQRVPQSATYFTREGELACAGCFNADG